MELLYTRLDLLFAGLIAMALGAALTEFTRWLYGWRAPQARCSNPTCRRFISSNGRHVCRVS